MEFFEHLKSYLSEEEIILLKESLDQPSKHALLLNTEKMEEDTLLNIYPLLKKHPLVKNGYLYDKNVYDLGRSIYHELGCFYLQEPSAMVVAFLLNPEENDTVLDLCAAPGGKTIQASLLMNNKGVIVANDISKNRALAILENAERMGRGNIVITNNDFSLISDNYHAYFDKIIVDAPCSGSGMFRKNNLMEKDWSYQKVLKYREIQKSLILMAYHLLKVGGTMVYSTCSFSFEENEEVISYLLDNSDAEILPLNHPLFYVNKKCPYGVHLLPYIFPGEGHYLCLIKKKGVTKNQNRLPNKSKLSFNIVDNGYSFFTQYGPYLYLQDKALNLKPLNIIRNGVKVGKIDKNEIRYDYHYARFVKDFPNKLAISEEQLRRYYLGESLDINFPKGYVLLTYQNLHVDIAKSDGRTIKNRLPKGLRKKFY